MSMNSFARAAAAAVALSALAAAPAQASVTFQGVVFSTSYINLGDIDSNPATDSMQLTLGIDASTMTGDWTGADFLNAVAVKASPSLLGVSLVSAPNPPASWALQMGGLNAGGCNGAGSGFFCIDGAGNGAPVPSNMTFVFDITAAHGSFSSAPEVKVEFVDQVCSAKKGCTYVKIGSLFSQEVPVTPPPPPPVPEPQTYALMLAGLGVMIWLARRRPH
jgi:hypothetical protein